MTRCTVTGNPQVNDDAAPVPNSATRADGQHVDHWVLCQAERAKGFVRPVRLSYRHVGRPAAEWPLRDLSEYEKRRYLEFVKFEVYPESMSPRTGRYWTQAEMDAVDKGCGTVTSMPQSIAETYAREPGYYSSTFCCGCGKYLPVGDRGEFVWDGTRERVGT